MPVDIAAQDGAFQGAGTPLTTKGFVAACEMLDCNAAELWAVLDVISGGVGFTPERRPLMIFERTAFHRETQGRIVDLPEISGRRPGGYGAAEAQYERLKKAMAVDRTSALRSASWGIGLLGGANFARAGYEDIDPFLLAMASSEDNQLTAFANHLRRRGLHALLRTQNWTEFARSQFGLDYRDSLYETQLKASYAKYATGLLPDLELREVQLHLSYLGYSPGPVDGLLGIWTRSALADFQAETEIRASGEPDRKTVTALKEKVQQLREQVPAAPIAEKRAS